MSLCVRDWLVRGHGHPTALADAATDRPISLHEDHFVEKPSLVRESASHA
jgi:hypothetical protein